MQRGKESILLSEPADSTWNKQEIEELSNTRHVDLVEGTRFSDQKKLDTMFFWPTYLLMTQDGTPVLQDGQLMGLN